MPGNAGQIIDDAAQTPSYAGSDIQHFRLQRRFEQSHVNLRDRTHIQKLALDIHVSQLNHRRSTPEVIDKLWHKKLRCPGRVRCN